MQNFDELAEGMGSGILTYEDAEPIKVHAPRVEMLPSPRQGFFGRIKDRVLGPVKKPQAVMVLDRFERELLKEYMENPEKVNAAVNACAVTADEIKEATDRLVVLARGHHPQCRRHRDRRE